MVAPRLVTPLGTMAALHGEQGGTGLDVSQQTPGYCLTVGPNGLSWITSPMQSMGGGSNFAIATKTANYNVAATDYTLLGDATAGNMTFTLPDAVANSGQIFNFKKTDASVNTVTVSGAQNIDGQASYIITTQYAAITIQSNGTIWELLNEKA